MTQPGGSATANGILYQILGAAHRAVSIRIDPQFENGELIEATLLIEPKGGGGDLQALNSNGRLVEQWKSRTDAGTWSLLEITSRVLPDLYRGVRLDQSEVTNRFRFVTEGRRGRCFEAESFFRELRSRPVPADPMVELDPQELIPFLPSNSLSQREFFQWIVAELRKNPDIAHEEESTVARKTWLMLANFEIHDSVKQDDLIAQVNGLLAPLMNYQEDVDGKRRELCTLLLETAAKGNAVVDPRSLLEQCGLNHHAFTDWAKRRSALQEANDHVTRMAWRYDPAQDIRPPVAFEPECRVAVFAGESGQGKTWRLASAVTATMRAGGAAVAIQSTRNAAQDLGNAAKAIWSTVFQRDVPIDLDVLARKRKEFFKNTPDPWLTVCIDNVTDFDEARALVEVPWKTHSMRLVISAPKDVALKLQRHFKQDVTILPVGNFTISELQEFLARRGRNWWPLSETLRDLLRRPLLAELFCETADGAQEWSPETEFDVYEKYWERISDFRTAQLGDEAATCSLARLVLDQRESYPFKLESLLGSGVSTDVLSRLEGCGWLCREDSPQRLAFVHDRLLNYAIAKDLGFRFLAGSLPIAELSVALGEILQGKHPGLGYVPLDFCWLLIKSGKSDYDVVEVLGSIEDQWHGHLLDGFYGDFLPRLGMKITRYAIKLSERPHPAKMSPRITARYLASTLVSLGADEPQLVTKHAIPMLDHPNEVCRWAAMIVLAKYPAEEALDRLWALHQQTYTDYQDRKPDRWMFAYGLNFDALRACARLAPNWLVKQIEHGGDQHHSELAYLVANVKGFVGQQLWHRVKKTLFLHVPDNKARSLATCIQQHNDRSEIAQLEKWLETGKEMTPQVAFAALVHLDPDRALKALGGSLISGHALTSNWWLRGLFARRPEETRRVILEVLKGDLLPLNLRSMFLKPIIDEINEETLDWLLDDLNSRVRVELEANSAGVNPVLNSLLGLLASICHPVLLMRFHSHGKGDLDDGLSELACRWVGRSTKSVDHELVHAQKVLEKIGGTGILRLVNQLLRSQHALVCLRGVELSLAHHDSGTRSLLREVAIRESDGSGSDQERYLRATATTALFALSENGAAIQAALRSDVVDDVAALREELPPIGDEDLQPAIQALGPSDERLQARAVHALSLSGRADLVPRVRPLLRTCDPRGEVARYLLLFLRRFGAKDCEAAMFYRSQLKIENHRYLAALALLQSDNPADEQALLEDAREHAEPYYDHIAKLVIADLAIRLQSRAAVAQMAIEKWDPCASAAFADMDRLPENIYEQLFGLARSCGGSDEALLCLRTLERFDTEAACRLAMSAALEYGDDTGSLVLFALTCDEPLALSLGLDSLDQERLSRVLWSLARGIRWFGKSAIVTDRLTAMLQDEHMIRRVVALELIAFQNDSAWRDVVEHIALNDADAKVRKAAEECFEQLTRTRLALALLAAVKESPANLWGAHVEAIVQLADPWLLETPGDPLCLTEGLQCLPVHIRYYASELLDERRRFLTRHAEDADRRRTVGY